MKEIHMDNEMYLNLVDNDSVIQKALNIMEYMSVEKRSLTIQEISIALSIPKATTHRIIAELKSRGYIGQHSDKSYFLTLKMWMISSQAMQCGNLMEMMLPYLNYFSQKYRCNVGISSFGLRNNTHLYTIGFDPILHLPMFLPGKVHPLSCTASGKIMLAAMDDVKLDEWLNSGRRFVPYTSKTKIDRAEIRREALDTRVRGYGTDKGEYQEFIGCVSVPLADETGRTAGAINFSVHIDRMDEINNPKVVRDVKETIRDLRV